MIKFENISQQEPYIRFVEVYKKALYAKQNNIKVSFSNSPIQTIHIGDPKRVMSIHKKAQMKNIYIQAIRYPTVPLNKDLIRINLTSDHSKKQIQSLIEFLKQVQ